jgi:ribonucleoside-diphosphate reductase alpha chain
MSVILVVKRNGNKEQINLEKIHQVVTWACEGLSGVSVSEIELRAQLQIQNGTKTSEIHEMLIKSAADLITADSPNYQFVAARLANYQLRKEVYGRFEPTTVRHMVEENVRAGIYTDELTANYTDADWRQMEKIVKHERDDLIAYAGMEQWRGKYLAKNRVTGQFYETPQMALILMSATGFMAYPRETRMTYVKDFYDAVSTFMISLPTPVMAGLRTPEKQFSSCVTISCGDSLPSIIATSGSVMEYISQKAGIGLDLGRIRAVDSEVAGGRKKHTGQLPIIRLMQSATKSMSQGGVRGGSTTVHYPLWHYEFEDLIMLKNNAGTEFNRIRHMDYSFLFNRTMYQRLVDNADISFFSPHDCPGLLDAYCINPDEFERLYTKYEADATIRRRTMRAADAFAMFLTQRKETGRIYLMNIDHANTHGSFIPELAPITQSNLCQEITLPTLPLKTLDDAEGRISLCTLAALNYGKVKTPDDFEGIANLTVRFLDELLSYQNFPVIAAERANEDFRPLGVGVINLAYFLAKNGLKYDQDALPLLDHYTEAFSYYLIKASVDLAEEKGPCKEWRKTKYGQGIMPIDTRKPAIDELVPHVERYDWETLRHRAMTIGIRNATLMAGMPAETSAQISNSTNGFEPVRDLVSEKKSKHGNLRQVVPEVTKLKNKYDLLWDQTSPRGYLMVVAVLQKYFDQSLSTNTSYNPLHYPDSKLSMREMILDLLLAYKWGIKNLYYHNTYDGDEDSEEIARQERGDIATQETAVVEQEECDSCVL